MKPCASVNHHHLAMWGVRRRSLPAGVFDTLQSPDARSVALVAGAREAFVFRTCERLELYLVYARASTEHSLPAPLDLDVFGVPTDRRTERDAAVHLHRVAAGLDSSIIGECQVFTQLRRAYVEAAKRGGPGPVISAAIRSAIHAGRRVRSETSLGQDAADLACLATNALEEHKAAASSLPTLLLGTGALAQDLARHLVRTRHAPFRVTSRHLPRARSFAERHGGTALPFDRIAEHVPAVGAIVCCTSSRQPVVTLSMLETRRPHNLLILDLGSPANVDPKVGSQPGILLRTLDQLLPPRSHTTSAHAAAARLVEFDVERFMDWWRRWEHRSTARRHEGGVAA